MRAEGPRPPVHSPFLLPCIPEDIPDSRVEIDHTASFAVPDEVKLISNPNPPNQRAAEQHTAKPP